MSPSSPDAPEILEGPGALSALADRLEKLGAHRVLLVCSPARRHLEPVRAALARFETEVFDGAEVHVPVEVVERAAARLEAREADTVVAVGGGSATGLGKALCLDHPLRLVAVPTTYSASEMTSIYGVRREGRKETGRDPRVRPSLVVHDPALVASLPIALAVQSLQNALAHPVSALETASLEGGDRAAALACAAELVRAIEDLLLAPAALPARGRALRAAAQAGRALDRGTMGVHHALAHLVGGSLALPHAAVHSVLLPHSLAHLRSVDPDLVAELEGAVGRGEIAGHLHDLLTRAGAPTSLEALGAGAAAVAELAASRPDLPAAVLVDAQQGLRPTAARIALGPEPAALLAGPAPARARRVVLALHGRGAEAGGMVRRVLELCGRDPETAVIGLRAAGNRWYGVRYNAPGAGGDPEVEAALARLDAALASLGAAVPPQRTVLAGFSQGACLALEYAARNPGRVAAVVAACGARIGEAAAWAPAAGASHAGLRVLVGIGRGDRWVDAADVEASAAWFAGAGAAVERVIGPGDRHDIAARLRVAARDVLLDRPAASGPAGFAGAAQSEALAGAVPRRQSSPRRAPYGLYAEQINGTGFTARRADNRRTWCYRIRPSTERRAFAPLPHPTFNSTYRGRAPEIELAGFAPLPEPEEPRDFVDGLVTLGGAGDLEGRRGWGVHLYAANRDMEDRAFYDGDGDLLLVPQLGALTALTELGPLELSPGEIAVLPRGIAFSIQLHEDFARGWLAEVRGRHFRLPERGPVGANGLAEERHFRAPAAWYEDRLAPGFRVVAKLGGRLHQATRDHSPFDVVGWRGNYAPTVYDLADFSPVANVRFDHGDPSIYTVLSAPLDEPGANLLDLVVFPPRWDVTENTFRPPFFHRNAVFELNGVVREKAAAGNPFVPGVTFITPPMTGHGVSGRTVERIRALGDAAANRPHRLGDGSIWFQLESSLPMSLTPWAEAHRLPDWGATWGSHASFFDPGAA